MDETRQVVISRRLVQYLVNVSIWYKWIVIVRHLDSSLKYMDSEVDPHESGT